MQNVGHQASLRSGALVRLGGTHEYLEAMGHANWMMSARRLDAGRTTDIGSRAVAAWLCCEADEVSVPVLLGAARVLLYLRVGRAGRQGWR